MDFAAGVQKQNNKRTRLQDFSKDGRTNNYDPELCNLTIN